MSALGLFGGLSAMGNEVALQRVGQEPVVYATGKVLAQMLLKDKVWTLKSGGGAGKPTERDIERVKYDVLNGYVSVEVARDHYGVVIDQATHKADPVRTARLRAYMDQQGLPVDEPLAPAAGSPEVTVQSDQCTGHAHPHGASRVPVLSRTAEEWLAEARAQGLLAKASKRFKESVSRWCERGCWSEFQV
ncbi:hypothetical protein CDEF62S_05397 [Castellaniella defragrans]